MRVIECDKLLRPTHCFDQKSMKKSILFAVLFVCVLVSCQKENKQAQLDHIKKLEATLAKQSNMDPKQARELIDKNIAFANAFPEDTLSPLMYYNAAMVSQGMRDYKGAIQILQDFIHKYPDDKRTPMALFTQAFIYDDNIGDKDKARELYDAFLKKYPNHPFAEQARQLLGVLGKDLNQMIEQFEKK